jgi:hypothetical protein
MSKIIPIIRIFDYDKAIEFYIGWLGFTIDWEHKPENAPIFMQVSMRDIVLRLSEHHGDGSPGIQITIEKFTGLREYHQLLINKNYKYNKPGVEVPEWNPKEINVTVIDPFGNQLHFTEEP